MASSDGEQCVDILLAGCRDADDFGVDGLLAGQLDLSEQPPDSGVEPQQCADKLLGHRHLPIAAADVRQFVAYDGFLGAGRHGQEFRRQQDYGHRDSERHRTGYFFRKTDRRPDTEAHLERVEYWRNRGQGSRAAAITAQARISGRKPAKPSQHSRAEQQRRDLVEVKPVARLGRGRSDGCRAHRHRNRRIDRRIIPGLQEGQEQTDDQQCLAIEQQGHRAANAQQQRRRGSGQDNGGDLHAIVHQVHQQEVKSHGLLLCSMVSARVRLSFKASLRMSMARSTRIRASA